MKLWNRLLAALLAAALLCAAPVVSAEEIALDDGGEVLPAQGAAEDGLEIDMEALPELPGEAGLELDDSMALSGELDLVGDESAGGEEMSGAEKEANDSSDFEIENGVLVDYKGAGGDVVIPDTVETIGYEAFGWKYDVVSVMIPDSVTSIEEKAFYNCNSLESVVIPDSVTSIGDSAFYACYSLKSVVIGKGLTKIGREVFGSCDEMTSVVIPDSVTVIEAMAFENCKSLPRVNIPDSVIRIGIGAFRYCEKLDDVVIPRYVAAIDAQAFMDCEELTSVTILSKKIELDVSAFTGSEPTLYIIEGSDAIQWAEENKYEYEVIGSALSETSLSMSPGETRKLEVIGSGSGSVTWSSSDNNVATVSSGQVRAVGEGKCTVSAKVSGGKTLKCAVKVTDPAKIDKTALSLKVGETGTLKVTGLAGRKVTWSSSDKKVATVSSGKVTAVGAGQCTVSAKLTVGKTLKCNVTVTDPAKLSDAAISLDVGDSQLLEASGLVGRSVAWSSSNKKVATVSGGMVKAMGAGKCVISAKVENGKTLKCKVTVTDPAKLSKTALSLKVGDTQTLTVSGLAWRSVTWSSSDKKIATVSKGKVKAVGTGKCIISAKVKGGKTLKCKVTVTDPAKLNKTKLTISAVDSATIKLTGASGKKVTWSSSKAGVAKITKSSSGSAKIAGVKPGTAVITAKIAGGKTLKCTVKVVAPLKMTTVKLANESGKRMLYARFSNQSGKKITYIKCDILQYDYWDQKLKSPYDSFDLSTTINAHASTTKSVDVNGDTDHVKYRIIEVRFSDGTTWKP